MRVLKQLLALFVGGVFLAAPSSHADGLLFDFGADATPTIGGPGGPATTWNNVTTIGTDDFGVLEGLLATDGTPSAINLQMESRFNGANEAGTTTANIYPATATRDSLFGNTEIFNGLENITPIFKLVGLNSAANYKLTFYASRTGVADNRETRYTVTGATATSVDLNAANNQTNTVTVTGMVPDAASEITIALTPGPNNDNANHFTYLGVLQIEASTGEKYLIDFGAGGSPTDVVEAPAATSWNNVTQTIGASDTGALDGLVTTNGTATSMNFRMSTRFNASNGNGVTTSTNFPATATQDSLFGNTETFNGLANVAPVFKLTGLDTNYIFTFTFFGSRNGVTDNRETRYTVTGANSGNALLNTANNTNQTVTVTDIRPTEAGEVTIALTPGPANNNANHFTYLGVMKVDFVPNRTPRILVDFGGPNVTDLGTDDPDNTWNNVATAIGSTDTGLLANLSRTDGSATTIGLQMVSRFNGANENGTQAGAPYPIDATRDSLFGNTEIFSGLENITPIFKLTGLNSATAYDFTFYASRLGVGDNRETHYTVTGATEATADLNVANNETEVATVNDIRPDSNGEITIALTPGPNNDNANHFTYLGVLQIDWSAPAGGAAPTLSGVSYANNTFRFTLNGTAGSTYKIQSTSNFTSWDDVQTITLTGASQEVQITAPTGAAYFRAVVQ
jgi:hypothetical protein